MKNTLLSLSTMVLLTLMAAGCEDEVENLSTDSAAVDRVRVGDLTFTLQILNMQGKPQAQFKEGENFQFQFVVKNNSKKAYVSSIPWDFPIVDEDFFALYRNTQESGGKAYVGKFFEMGKNFRDLNAIEIPGNSNITYTIPWMIDEGSVYNMPEDYSSKIDREYIKTETSAPLLKDGEYFTEFTVKYNEVDSIHLEASFIVR